MGLGALDTGLARSCASGIPSRWPPEFLSTREMHVPAQRPQGWRAVAYPCEQILGGRADARARRPSCAQSRAASSYRTTLFPVQRGDR